MLDLLQCCCFFSFCFHKRKFDKFNSFLAFNPKATAQHWSAANRFKSKNEVWKVFCLYKKIKKQNSFPMRLISKISRSNHTGKWSSVKPCVHLDHTGGAARLTLSSVPQPWTTQFPLKATSPGDHVHSRPVLWGLSLDLTQGFISTQCPPSCISFYISSLCNSRLLLQFFIFWDYGNLGL